MIRPTDPRPGGLPSGPVRADSPSAATGKNRAAGDTPASEDPPAALADCVQDLQRVKAEYDNYRKRVHRDRLALREIAVANVLQRLLPVLDTIAAAREHGEVTGGFAQVADLLEKELIALGLQPFGSVGDPFDPVIHEAVTHSFSEDAERATCTEILRAGYRVGDSLLRPAQVAVTDAARADAVRPGMPTDPSGPVT